MVLTIDLGGTKLQYALFEGNSSIISITEPTQKDFVAQLQRIISSLASKYPDLIDMMSIGVPGPIKNNVMQGSKPLNCTKNIDFTIILNGFNIPFIVKNDLNMAVYYELHRGAGKRHKNFCLISLSTGIGVAVVNNGNILEGRIEMGHQVFFPEFQPQQACTNHMNCWVSLASGIGIEKRFATDKYQTTEDIIENVLDKIQIDEIKAMNAQAFGNLINAYDPDVIVIMGSLGLKQFHKIIPDAKTIERFTINRPVPKIIKCQAGNDIGIIGANYAAYPKIVPLND